MKIKSIVKALFLLLALQAGACTETNQFFDSPVKPETGDEGTTPDPEDPTGGDPVDEPAFAFPGAEGGGMNTTGGRGGKVYTVTSLEDTNTPGTLRHAVGQQGARIVVFNVSGTIYLKSTLDIRNDHITIAGQTAPGDGICLAHFPVNVSANNVILRYLRVRMGDTDVIGSGGSDGSDAMGGRQKLNVIIDHCSISWSTDECASFYDNKNFTMQWCIISESLRLSGHSKGPHGYGGIWGGVNASYHHNLMAHHDSRTPRFGSGVVYQGQERTDMRNNVIYNWSGNGCYGGAAMGINILNNYYKPGPATDAKVANRVMAIDISTSDGDFTPIKGKLGKYHITGNVFSEGKNLSSSSAAAVTSDNWSGIRNNTGHDIGELKVDSPLETDAVTTHTAQVAYDKVLQYAGCNLNRDEIDIRIVEETRTGAAAFIGLSKHNGKGVEGDIDWKSQNYPKPGLLDSQNDLKPSGAIAGWTAWPVLKPGEAIVDSDGDGMPDTWEKANGLNPEKYDANGHNLSTAYDNVEVYINSLVKEITEGQK